MSVAVPRETLQKEGFHPEESRGLFVGISKFDDSRFSPVPFAVDDAVDLAWVFALELGLIEPSGCVLALAGEPQKEHSRVRLAGLLAAQARIERPQGSRLYRTIDELAQDGGRRGLFLFSAATHGLSESGSGDYLIASDTWRKRLQRTSLVVNELLDAAAQARPERRLLLLDACRERFELKRGDAADAEMSESFASALAAAKGLCVLSATNMGGKAYEDAGNGVFSGALVEGLLGAAGPDERGYITTATLAEHAQMRVQQWVKRHRSEDETTLGIQNLSEINAKSLPLAIDPRRKAEMETWRQHREQAIRRVRERIGGTEVLDGHLFEEIRSILLAGELPTPEIEALVSQIESLDGSAGEENRLLFLVRGLRGKLRIGRPRPGTGRLVVTRPQKEEMKKAPFSSSPQPGDWRVDSFGLAFRWIPGGRYLIGSPPEDRDRDVNEAQAEVTIEGFWLAEMPTTQGIWMQHVGKNPSTFTGNYSLPVEHLSWFDAVQFANLLSEKARLEPCYYLSASGSFGEEDFTCIQAELKSPVHGGYRLPSEAEWEVAARAQHPGDPAYRGRYGELDLVAWYQGNSGRKTHPVGQKAANAWGLRDMLGNVWEWTNDVGAEGTERRIRGGSFLRHAKDVRASCRLRIKAGARISDLGLRLCLGHL